MPSIAQCLLKTSSNHDIYEDLRKSYKFFNDNKTNENYIKIMRRLRQEPDMIKLGLPEDNMLGTFKVNGNETGKIDTSEIENNNLIMRLIERSNCGLRSYLVDGMITMVDHQVLISLNTIDLRMHKVIFVSRFYDDGFVIFGVSNSTQLDGNDGSFSVYIGRDRIWMRRGLFNNQIHYERLNLPDQDRVITEIKKIGDNCHVKILISTGIKEIKFQFKTNNCRPFVTAWSGVNKHRFNDITVEAI